MKRFFLSLAVAVIVAASATAAFAQPGGGFGGPGGGFGGGFGGGGGGGLDLLRDENVRKDLELVDEQVEKLTEIQGRMREVMGDFFRNNAPDFRNMRDLSEDERRAQFDSFRTKVEEAVAPIQKEVDEVLLPHQKERLKQIQNQARMRGQGTSQALTSGTLAEELGITDEQKEKLRAVEQEVQAELLKEIERLRTDAREKVLEVLTPEQREKYKTMMGSPIEFSQGRGPGGRGPGGAAGGRGPGAAGGTQRGPERPASGD